MTDKKETIEKLDNLTDDDPRQAHVDAEKIVYQFLTEIGHKDVADAFENAAGRVGFWYA